MSRTLFAYILKDLLRIFVLATVALAAIMSFGGLLRPLTEQGLNPGQMSQMLAYFLPAMTAYSLPIAALFATTMVYGRLSADNELTACRAAGISYLWISTPALVLGLAVAIISILFLCYIVPVFTLKVEKVIYSNLAQLVANKIERNHQIRLRDYVIFAESAHLQPAEIQRSGEQVVVLSGPMFVKYARQEDDAAPLVPEDFYMASQATIYISQDEAGERTQFEAYLEQASKFPRSLRGGIQAGIEHLPIGPIPLPSPIQEETKFMDLQRLKELAKDPGRSQRIAELVRDFVRGEQQHQFLRDVRRQMNKGGYELSDGSDGIVLTHEGARLDLGQSGLFAQPTDAADGARPIRFELRRGDSDVLQAQARELRVKALPLPQQGQMSISLDLRDALVSAGGETVARQSFTPGPYSVPMPEEIARITERGWSDYLESPAVSPDGQALLRREILKLTNGVLSELHGRASFAISCLILVVVGCGLGMMFRSGNFLSAFALSVVPALLCITLIVTGQQTCENIPRTIDGFHNPLKLGLGLIWSGNVIVLGIATGLMWKLQRS